MGHHRFPRRLSSPRPALPPPQSFPQDPHLLVPQHLYHPLVYGILVRRYQLLNLELLYYRRIWPILSQEVQTQVLC